MERHDRTERDPRGAAVRAVLPVSVHGIGGARRLGRKLRGAQARRHIVGSIMFGIGWGVADACPGPIATQLGQGIAWGLWTLAGVVIGVAVFLHRKQAETEPATDTAGAIAVAERTAGASGLTVALGDQIDI
jgi:uncharacterized membrane protein YedE/YeeE